MNPVEQILLNQLKNKNYQAYNQFLRLKSSGKTPDEVLSELISNGTFTQEQVNQVKAKVEADKNIKKF